MKISVQGVECFPHVLLMTKHLRAAGFEAYPDPDGFPRGQDVLWYVGAFSTFLDTVPAMRKLYPKMKVVLQWAGSDILFNPTSLSYDFADFHVTACQHWAQEVSEKFSVQCRSIELTPLRVLDAAEMPSTQRILVYGHWDKAGGEKYLIPWILKNISPEIRRKAEIHVIGTGWRAFRFAGAQYHTWIEGEEEKLRFWRDISVFVWMHKFNALHKYGGFVSLSPIEFAQMGRQVVRNGVYPFMVHATPDNFNEGLTDALERSKTVDQTASEYYRREYPPQRCQNALKEVLKQLE